MRSGSMLQNGQRVLSAIVFYRFFYLKNEEYPELTGNQAVWTDWCGLQGLRSLIAHFLTYLIR